MNVIDNKLFYCTNKDTYPPFKNGLYLEEYFFLFMRQHKINLKRKYIPALWTNFQIEPWLRFKIIEMQKSLDDWIKKNPSSNGYFVIVQHDNGVMLKLPPKTIVFNSGNNGHIPLPLIYQDIDNKLEKIPRKKFSKKKNLCSFVGTLTHKLRSDMFKILKEKNHFLLIDSGAWSANIKIENQRTFIDTTIDSKFALAPRGYGRSSFRFFEIMQLGCIPVYIWDDIEWLPYKDVIDYEKLCISINIKDINTLEEKLLKIDEIKYNEMLNYYNEKKFFFNLNGMSNYIVKMIGVN